MPRPSLKMFNQKHPDTEMDADANTGVKTITLPVLSYRQAKMVHVLTWWCLKVETSERESLQSKYITGSTAKNHLFMKSLSSFSGTYMYSTHFW